MEELLGVLLEFLFEVLLQLVAEFAAELGIEAMRRALRHSTGSASSLAIASLGQIVLGVAAGAATVLFVPTRILPMPRVPGISLLLSPLATGILMSVFGNWSRRRGRPTSALATFRGGLLFAFACAAARYYLVVVSPL